MKSIQNKLSQNLSLTTSEAEEFLDYIIRITKKAMFKDEKENYTNKCDLAQSIICYLLEKNNIEYNPCMTLNILKEDIIGHSYTICYLNIDNKKTMFLLDPTYIQFFNKENITKERYYIYNNMILRTPDPGYYINTQDLPLIEKFIQKGYNKFDTKFAWIYGNSFHSTLRGRNINEDLESISGEVFIQRSIMGNEKLSKSQEEIENMLR